MQQVDLPFKSYVFCITSCNYTIDSAGTSRVVRAHQRQALAAGLGFVAAFPITKNLVAGGRVYSLHTGVYGVLVNGQYAGVQTRSQLLHLLGAEGRFPCAVLLHHLIWHRIPDVQKIISALPGVPVLFYLHDFYTCCVQPNLLKNNTAFCSAQGCSGCMFQRARLSHLRRVNALLGACADRITFIAPSDFTKAVWAAVYPQYERKAMVLPHLNPVGVQQAPPAQAPLRVAYVGGQTREKGWEIWREITKDAKDAALFSFSSGQEVLPKVQNVRVEAALQGQDAMTNALKAHGIQAVALLSIVPETYSFTMYESRAAGCYVLTLPESGNIARTVAKEDFGHVYQSAAEMAAALHSPAELLAEMDACRRQHPQIPAGYEDSDAWLALLDKQTTGTVKPCGDTPFGRAVAAVLGKMYARKRL